MVQVDRRDLSNPFRQDKVRMNLHGDQEYSTTLAWMSKFRRETQTFDTNFITYVDDSKVTDGSEAEACRSERVVGSI